MLLSSIYNNKFLLRNLLFTSKINFHIRKFIFDSNRNFFKKKFLFLSAGIILLTASCSPESTPKDDANYLVKVFDYVYAPGQHAQIAQMADTAQFTGNPEDNSFVYLGGFGGYISAAFKKDVINDTGKDFAVWAMRGASAEPAVVWVMEDVNKDGLPNETWYQLKGSEQSVMNYTLTYTKTDSCVNWSDSKGQSGTLVPGYGAVNSKNWWWPHSQGNSISLTGTLLPDVMEDADTTSSQSWQNIKGKFLWGYAENNLGEDYFSEKGYNALDISNAVDAEGNNVNLTKIRFIKVQSAVFQIAGWLNEVSPEVRGASEL